MMMSIALTGGSPGSSPKPKTRTSVPTPPHSPSPIPPVRTPSAMKPMTTSPRARRGTSQKWSRRTLSSSRLRQCWRPEGERDRAAGRGGPSRLSAISLQPVVERRLHRAGRFVSWPTASFSVSASVSSECLRVFERRSSRRRPSRRRCSRRLVGPPGVSGGLPALSIARDEGLWCASHAALRAHLGPARFVPCSVWDEAPRPERADRGAGVRIVSMIASISPAKSPPTRRRLRLFAGADRSRRCLSRFPIAAVTTRTTTSRQHEEIRREAREFTPPGTTAGPRRRRAAVQKRSHRRDTHPLVGRVRAPRSGGRSRACRAPVDLVADHGGFEPGVHRRHDRGPPRRAARRRSAETAQARASRGRVASRCSCASSRALRRRAEQRHRARRRPQAARRRSTTARGCAA